MTPRSTRRAGLNTLTAALLVAASTLACAQNPSVVRPAASATDPVYTPTPSFDLTSIDSTVSPCNDFYKFACGHYAEHHPIPADMPMNDGFVNLYNVNTQYLRTILEKAESASARTPNQQKIGDYYHACMDASAIDAQGLKPVQPLLQEIDSVSLLGLPALTGRLQRDGVNVLFSFGEQQDLKDATKQIAYIDQGGLGMPERDFYLRTGTKDEELRKAYVAYIVKILTLSGVSPEKAAQQAAGIMTFETALAKASMDVTSRRDPEKTYHLVPASDITKYFPMGSFGHYEEAVHAPHVAELNDANPDFVPALVQLVRNTDIQTIRAYMRFHLLSDKASNLPETFDQAHWNFYDKVLYGEAEESPRWKRCSGKVDGALGEALGQVYVQQYFAGDSKAKMLTMVHDIENAMDKDIDTLDWMSPATKLRAKEKLHGIANKIGYPDRWRDYASLEVKPDDPFGNSLRASNFENDRQLRKIGQPVDHQEWGHDPAHRERLLRPLHERHQLPRRYPSARLLRPESRRRRQLRPHRCRRRPRTHPRLRRRRQKVRRQRQSLRLVDPGRHQKV